MIRSSGAGASSASEKIRVAPRLEEEWLEILRSEWACGGENDRRHGQVLASHELVAVLAEVLT